MIASIKGLRFALGKTLFSLSLLFVLFLGVVRYPDDNIVPSWAFDLILVILFVGHVLKYRSLGKLSFLPAIFFIIYAAVNFFSEIAVVEILYILRPWAYMAVFATIATRFTLSESFLTLLIVFILLKYAIIWPIYGVYSRPGFFQEINFDLLLLLMVLLTETIIRNHFVVSQRKGLASKLSVGFIVLGSLSRSGLIAYSLMFIRAKRVSFLVILMAGLTILFLLISLIIRPESGGLEGIDRFIWAKFVLTFISVDYQVLFLGNHPIKYLSPEVCNEFGQFRYQYLGFEGDRCLSNVFTSHILRFPYEFGLIGTSIFYLLLLAILNRRDLLASHYFLAVGLLVVNGLSVSGLSSAYSFVGLSYLTSRVNEFRRIAVSAD